MDQMLIEIFQDEIKRQSSFALSSISNINYFFDSDDRTDADYLWYYVQNFLTSSANVSKLLWGSNEKQNHSRKKLRESLKVREDSILFSKTLRNDFEHYDERIERWFKESERRNYIDSNIGPTGFIAGADPSDFLRNYDTTLNAVTFKGTVYELQPIVDELLTLNMVVKKVINNRYNI